MSDFSLHTNSLNESDMRLEAHYSVEGKEMHIELTLVVDSEVKTLKISKVVISDDKAADTPASI